VTLRRALGLSVAGVMILVGAPWTAQGLGWIGGSSMSGESFWAIVGPIVAGLGVALVITIVGKVRRQGDETDLDRRYGGRR